MLIRKVNNVGGVLNKEKLSKNGILREKKEMKPEHIRKKTGLEPLRCGREERWTRSAGET